jgi:hypothetical protein
MWYYNVNNQPTGPVDDTMMQSMIKSGAILPTTLVWQEGMSNWQAASSTALAAIIPTVNPVPAVPMTNMPPQSAPAGTMMQQPQMGYQNAPMSYPPMQPAYPQPQPGYPQAQPGYPAYQFKPAGMQIKELNDLFMWFWICLIGMVVTAGASAIASLVLFFIILHRCWALIQDGYARTTPGKAVGFCFIPFFNFYWIFEAFVGLSKDMNAFIYRRQLPIMQNNEGVATAFSILMLLNYVPYVDFVTGIAWFILWIIFTKNIKETAVMIIQYTQK